MTESLGYRNCSHRCHVSDCTNAMPGHWDHPPLQQLGELQFQDVAHIHAAQALGEKLLPEEYRPLASSAASSRERVGHKIQVSFSHPLRQLLKEGVWIALHVLQMNAARDSSQLQRALNDTVN